MDLDSTGISLLDRGHDSPGTAEAHDAQEAHEIIDHLVIDSPQSDIDSTLGSEVSS